MDILIACIGIALVALIALTFVFVVYADAKSVYVAATERLHQRRMETLDKLLAIENARSEPQEHQE